MHQEAFKVFQSLKGGIFEQWPAPVAQFTGVQEGHLDESWLYSHRKLLNCLTSSLRNITRTSLGPNNLH